MVDCDVILVMNGIIYVFITQVLYSLSENVFYYRKLREAEERTRGRSGCPVPLCWDDQMKQESIKIVSPGASGDDDKFKVINT